MGKTWGKFIFGRCRSYVPWFAPFLLLTDFSASADVAVWGRVSSFSLIPPLHEHFL